MTVGARAAATAVDAPSTLLDALVLALRRAAAYNANDAAPPAVVLWPDADGLWAPLLPLLRERSPATGSGQGAGPDRVTPIVLTLGPWDSVNLTGPAYWLRCAIAGQAPDLALPPGSVPVIYLPDVSRADLRGVEECPKHLQPLVELQYRGAIWSHPNGRDWTPAAFLESGYGGLGIAVQGDGATREALARALPVLAREPLADLRREAPLDAAFLDRLLNPDPLRALLRWLEDPDAVRAARTVEEWAAFAATCRSEWGFDPERDGPLTAARKLGERTGRWKEAWVVFADAPDRFPGIAGRLGQAEPVSQPRLFAEPGPTPGLDDPHSSWPGTNRREEELVRRLLADLPGGDPSTARAAVLDLERIHGGRRGWVWAELGQA
ncbi:MAG: hypothetical protein M3Q10_00165, partial [Chloroflexota bacterium]|nr:hypothetical protein [Chloroflexota bacterium]